MKEYRRIINREYILIKSTIDKYGQFVDVKIVPYHRRYYVNMCSYCKNYLYLTSIECKSCHKNLCERHLSQCECEKKQWILIIKELNKDRLSVKNVVPLIEVRTKEMQ